MGVCGLVLSWVWSYMLCRAGMSLLQNKRWTFCFVMAILLCLNPPLGTILGVFTIVVLNRPSVKELFGRNEPASSYYRNA